MKTSKVGTVAASLLLAAGMTAFGAGEDAWKLEITPYLWAAGIDADVKVNGQEFEIDQKFSDLIEHVDAAAALLIVAEKNHWQLYGQGDYVSLNADETHSSGVHGEIEANTVILTGGFGYEFAGFNEKARMAVLLGGRFTHMDNEIILDGQSSGKDNNDLLDGLVILRGRYNFTEKFRFSPTLNIGAGDSDLTYELQPEFQYDFTETMSGRIGYRRVHYKEEFSADSEFDGEMSGFLVGLGWTL